MNKPVVREGFVADEPVTVDAVLPAQPVEDTEPAEPVETWPIKVRLMHKPIFGNQHQEVRELSFREPTAADINRHGNPCRFNQDGDMVIDERKMTMIMASLSGILSPFLERMDPRDWNSCAYRLRYFFLPDPKGW